MSEQRYYGISDSKLKKIKNTLSNELNYTVNEIEYDMVCEYYGIIFNRVKNNLCEYYFNKYKPTFENIEDYINCLLYGEWEDIDFVDGDWIDTDINNWKDKIKDIVIDNLYFIFGEIGSGTIHDTFDIFECFDEYVKNIELSLKINKVKNR